MARGDGGDLSQCLFGGVCHAHVWGEKGAQQGGGGALAEGQGEAIELCGMDAGILGDCEKSGESALGVDGGDESGGIGGMRGDLGMSHCAIEATGDAVDMGMDDVEDGDGGRGNVRDEEA